jgi:acetate kinase
MGLTPLEGLVMGTRSGDIDPACCSTSRGARHVDRRPRRPAEQAQRAARARGSSDCRDIRAAIERGDAAATLAFEVYVHRLRAYAGAYLAQLGGVDVISFTAGVGENARASRAARSRRWASPGSRSTRERNEAPGAASGSSPRDASRVTVLVVPTNEELEIARQTLRRRDYAGVTARRRAAHPLISTLPEVTWPRTPFPI